MLSHASKFSSADDETPIGTRNSFFGSNGARRACKVSLNLSPAHRSGTKASASVDHTASRNQSQAAVPTTAASARGKTASSSS